MKPNNKSIHPAILLCHLDKSLFYMSPALRRCFAPAEDKTPPETGHLSRVKDGTVRKITQHHQLLGNMCS